MAEKQSDTKSFAQFLNEQPAPPETVTLTGSVARSSRPGSFLFTAGGQSLELPVDAVQSHKVLGEGLVELQVLASKLDANKVAKPVVADIAQTNPFLDHHHTIKEVVTDPLVDKHVHKDPIFDVYTLPETIGPDPTNTAAEGVGVGLGGQTVNPAAGLEPFVLATPHHAPASTIAAQMGTPAGAQLHTIPTIDVSTIFWLDRPHTIKEIAKDPIFDRITLPENVIPDPTNTLAEGIGGLNPGGTVVNPAVQQFAAMAQPGFAAQMGQMITNPLVDRPHTVPQFDHPYTIPTFDVHTFKELIKDPIQDPITIWEGLPGGGGGTLQEGVGGLGGITNPVWNLPGMMF